MSTTRYDPWPISPILNVTPEGCCPVCLEPNPHVAAWIDSGRGPLTVEHVSEGHHRWRPDLPTASPPATG